MWEGIDAQRAQGGYLRSQGQTEVVLDLHAWAVELMPLATVPY